MTSDSIQIGLALSTDTGLQPELVPDYMWFEAYVGDILVRTVQVLIDRNDLLHIEILGRELFQTSASLSQLLAVDEIAELLHRLKPLVSQQLRIVNPQTVDSDDVIQRMGLALLLADIYDLVLIQEVLGLSRRVETITAESFQSVIANLNWRQVKDVYTTGLPQATIEQLKQIQRGLEFERLVEGTPISPLWYQQQLAASSFTRWLANVLNNLMIGLDETFVKEGESLVNEEKYVSAAQVIQRGLEACHKYTFHYQIMKGCFERLSSLRKVADIPWLVIDWESHSRRIESSRRQLIFAYSSTLPALMELPKTKYWPDYFGQAYSVLAEECYKAMSITDEDIFKKLFPAVFKVWLHAYEHVGEQLRDRDDHTRLVFQTDPVVDILQLSGYACIYVELDKTEIWRC